MGRPKKRIEETETTRITVAMGSMIREMIAGRKGYSVTDYVIDHLKPLILSEYADFLKHRPTYGSILKPPRKKPD